MERRGCSLHVRGAGILEGGTRKDWGLVGAGRALGPQDKVARKIGGFPVHSEKDRKVEVMFAGMTEIDLGKKRKFAKGNEKIDVGVMMIKKEDK